MESSDCQIAVEYLKNQIL